MRIPCRRPPLVPLAWLTLAAPLAAAPGPWSLQLDPTDLKPQRIRAVLEVDGQILGESPVKLPLQVRGEMVYDEQLLEVRPDRRRAWREYAQAQAVLRINNREYHSVLPNDRRNLVYASSDQGRLFYCPAGPLSRQTWDLIDLPGSSTELDQLLPASPVSLGDSWKIPPRAAARILGIERIDQGEVQARLVEVQDSLARIHLQGKVEGQVAGATTEMQMQAKLNFDCQARRLRWFAMAIKEARQAGPVGPAVRLTARLRLTLNPIDTTLTPPPEDALPEPDPARIPLELESPTGQFALIHDARWFPITQQRDPQVLRRVELGRVIAQCRIARLNTLPEGRQLGLEQFQDDIRQALGSQVQELVSAEQSTTASGLRALRVVAVGEVQKAPIQWIYYHLSDEQGHRAALVFTLEASQVEHFGGDDLEIAGSFRFVPVSSSPEAPEAPAPQARRPSGPSESVR